MDQNKRDGESSDASPMAMRPDRQALSGKTRIQFSRALFWAGNGVARSGVNTGLNEDCVFLTAAPKFEVKLQALEHALTALHRSSYVASYVIVSNVVILCNIGLCYAVLHCSAMVRCVMLFPGPVCYRPCYAVLLCMARFTSPCDSTLCHAALRYRIVCCAIK